MWLTDWLQDAVGGCGCTAAGGESFARQNRSQISPTPRGQRMVNIVESCTECSCERNRAESSEASFVESSETSFVKNYTPTGMVLSDRPVRALKEELKELEERQKVVQKLKGGHWHEVYGWDTFYSCKYMCEKVGVDVWLCVCQRYEQLDKMRGHLEQQIQEKKIEEARVHFHHPVRIDQDTGTPRKASLSPRRTSNTVVPDSSITGTPRTASHSPRRTSNTVVPDSSITPRRSSLCSSSSRGASRT